MTKAPALLDYKPIFNEVVLDFKTTYTTKQKDRCSFGSIPPELHAQILERAKSEGMTIAQFLAGLFEFLLEYDEANGADLLASRTPKRKLLGTV